MINSAAILRIEKNFLSRRLNGAVIGMELARGRYGKVTWMWEGVDMEFFG